jgi:hypothetical protein
MEQRKLMDNANTITDMAKVRKSILFTKTYVFSLFLTYRFQNQISEKTTILNFFSKKKLSFKLK